MKGKRWDDILQFRLTYRGKLKGRNSSSVVDKQELRRHFHKQLKVLWAQSPLNEATKQIDPNAIGNPHEVCLLRNVGQFTFAPIVSSVFGWNTVAELDILFLRPSPAGALLGHGGDRDNRIKTLMDCLRMPAVNEFPPNDKPSEDETPFFVLLEDDALVTAFSVTSDQLLMPTGVNEVELVIYVKVGATRQSNANSILP